VIEEGDGLPGVLASPKSLQEAVSNVLDNAFKYLRLPKPGSPFTKNPRPRVRIRFLANNPAWKTPGVTILVEDNGPGIPNEERDAIFQRGYRSPTTNNAVEGSGLGLSICQTLMSRMGGNLEVVSQPSRDYPDALDGAVLKFVLFRNPPIH
jgi:signal transduction histidine kinase